MENPLPAAAASLSGRYVTGADGWQMRVLSWTPHAPEASRRPPVLIVPGWTSVIEGWLPLLAAWVETRPVHYIETREKNESQCPQGHSEQIADFTIPNHARDLAAISEELGTGSRGNWFCSSLAATILLEGLKSGILGARSAFLLAPNAEFVFPWWVSTFSHLPSWIYPPLIRGLVIPAMRWRTAEEGQRIRYTRTLLQADVRRLKMSMRANQQYVVWPDLETVSVPCAVCVAGSDTLHTHDDALRIARTLVKGTVIEVASNQAAHEPEIIPVVETWLAKAEGEPDARVSFELRESRSRAAATRP